MSKLTLALVGDTGVIVRRLFDAPPKVVYSANTDPELLKIWLLGPEGWTMPVCISEPMPGGRIRYEWDDGQGGGFFLTGEFIELEPFRRTVHVERMHLPDATPDNRVETVYEASGTGTLMSLRMTLRDAATGSAMLATGMEQGMESSYSRLDEILTDATQESDPR